MPRGGVLLAAGATLGIAKAVHAHESADRAQYEATQKKLAPVLGPLMVRINKQMLRAQVQDPNHFYQHRVGKNKVEIDDLSTANGNADTYAVMGTYTTGPHKGQPNPDKPIYFNSLNGTTSGKLKTVASFAIAAPAGESYAAQYSQLGGSANGWTATEIGGVDMSGTNGFDDGMDLDTTDPSMNTGIGDPTPSPKQVAEEIATDWNNYGQV